VGKSGKFTKPPFQHTMQLYHVIVPCKNYIKKYFSSLYGEKIHLDHRSDFGDTILSKMSGYRLAHFNKRTIHLELQNYQDKIIFIPTMEFYSRNEGLTTLQIYNINRYLENCFKSDMFNCISVGSFFGVSHNTVIRKFLFSFEIDPDEDLSYAAMKKAYYRHSKSSFAKNSFLSQMSSPFKMNIHA